MSALFFAILFPSALAASTCDVVVAAGDVTGDGLENTGIDPDEIDVAEAIVDGLSLHGIDPDEIDLTCQPTIDVLAVPLTTAGPGFESFSLNLTGLTATTREHVLLARQVSRYDSLGRLTNVTGRLVVAVDAVTVREEVDRYGRGTGRFVADLELRVTGAEVPRGYTAVGWKPTDTTLTVVE